MTVATAAGQTRRVREYIVTGPRRVVVAFHKLWEDAGAAAENIYAYPATAHHAGHAVNGLSGFSAPILPHIATEAC